MKKKIVLHQKLVLKKNMVSNLSTQDQAKIAGGATFAGTTCGNTICCVTFAGTTCGNTICCVTFAGTTCGNTICC